MSELRTIAIVGGSLAGLRAAEALRRRGFDGRIEWIGAEDHLPYDRPPLSKQILDGTWTPERCALRKNAPVSDLAAQLHFGRRAVALDPELRRVTLDDGQSIAYDGLIIATGARPRTLRSAGDLEGVHTLRTLEDALLIRDALERGARVLIVGAGFIGLEVAAACRKRGLPVTIVDALATPLTRSVGETMGKLVQRIHADAGVQFHFNRFVRAVEGTGRAERVILDDGSRLEADLVVVGIGVVPETDWLVGSGLTLNDGVVCDSSCHTGAPNVVAAGDVVRWNNPLFDTPLRVEHWTNAVEQATTAVSRLLDGPEKTPPLASVPYFWSDQYDLKLQFVGHCLPGDRVHVVEPFESARRFIAVYERQGTLSGAVVINRAASLMKYRPLVAARANIESVLQG